MFILCSRPNVEQHLGWIESVDSNAIIEERILQYQSLLMIHPNLSIDPYAYQFEKIEKQIDDIIDNWDCYNEILEQLTDEKSRDILMRMIIYRLTYNPLMHKGIKTKYPHYFDQDVLTLSDDEIFVDCGGYNGDTLRAFKEISNNKFQHYYLFEPDSSLIKIAKDSAKQDDRFTFINKGVWDKEETLKFYAENSAGNGTIVMKNRSNNVIEIPVTKLDNILQNATYIKMDVEGSELAALHGAEQVIRKCHPKLAICVYHKYADYIELFNCIQSMGDYQFFIRAQYDNIDMELYYLCIPRKVEIGGDKK